MFFPVAIGRKPGKGSREGRIIPAPRQPGGMMHHAQGPQSLDQVELTRVKVIKLLIAGEDVHKLQTALGSISREHHP